jgi:hypothetical protein
MWCIISVTTALIHAMQLAGLQANTFDLASGATHYGVYSSAAAVVSLALHV